MIKVNVSPRQMTYYKNAFEEGDKINTLSRMTKEFKLGLSLAKEIYDQFPSSFNVMGESMRPLLPSHARDDRVAIYLPENIVTRLDELMGEIFDGDAYDRFMEITSDDREKVFQQIVKEFSTEDESQLNDAVRQYPFGILPITTARSMDNIEEMSEMLHGQIDEGRDLSQVASDFLRASSHWTDDERVAAYIAVAEVLYGRARSKMKEIKENMGSKES